MAPGSVLMCECMYPLCDGYGITFLGKSLFSTLILAIVLLSIACIVNEWHNTVVLFRCAQSAQSQSQSVNIFRRGHIKIDNGMLHGINF